MKNSPDFLLPCTQGGLNRLCLRMPRIFKRKLSLRSSIIALFLLFSFQQIAVSQTPSLDIKSAPTTDYMSSYLNGIDRNNYEGYIDRTGTDGWYETQYPAKLNTFANVSNAFAFQGQNLYRVGHDVHDGVAQNGQFGGRIFPGWHWATDYKTGDLLDIWKSGGQQGPPPAGICDKTEISPVRLGAGVHRFLFSLPVTNSQGQQVPGASGYMGFAVNVNYPEGFTYVKVPKSFTIYNPITTSLGVESVVKTIIKDFDVRDPNGTKIQPELINFGYTGSLYQGNHLLQFRFRYYEDAGIVHVNYYGIVLSINSPITQGSGDPHPMRTQSDVHLMINPNAGGSVIERHSVMPNSGWPVPRITTNSSILDTDGTVHPINTAALTLCQESSFGYDNIMYALGDAKDLKADLSFVVNTGSGSPREAVGLLEFLKEREAPVVMIELGSEMMGDWNVGTIFWRFETQGNTEVWKPQTKQTTEELADWQRQFALALRNSTYGNSVKLALTSTWDIEGRFTNGTTPYNGFKMLAQRMQSNGKCMVDYVNVHNYPKCEPNNNYTDDKKRWLLGCNHLFESNYEPNIKAALADGGCSKCDLIVSESNTLAEDNTQEMNFFMEGMFTAQSFATIANLRGKSFTPFAFCKEQGVTLPPNTPAGDPSSPTLNRLDEKRFNLLFYQNNATLGQDIIAKPLFMLKRMLAENLGQVLLKSEWKVPQSNALQATERTNATSFNYPKLYILPTRASGYIYTLILNREMPGAQDQELMLSVDNVPAASADIMSLYATDTGNNSKKPYKTKLGQADSNVSNMEKAEFKPATFPLKFKPFSVNILRVAVAQTPVCATLLNTDPAVPISLNGYTLNWQPQFGIVAYKVIVGTSDNGNEILETETQSTYLTLNNLPFCSDIYIRVLPINENRVMAICPPIRFKTTCVPPPICTNFTSPTNTQVDISTTPTITWNAAQNATGYTLQVGSSTGANNLGNYSLANVTSFTIPTALPSCQEVYFTIIPFNASGQAQNCPSIVAKTVCCVGCNDLTISSNTTWSQPNGVQSYGTITVKNNSTLTIPSGKTISFCPSGSLVIEPGSTLLLSGTLTSCGNEWQGVVVQDQLNTGSTTPKRGQITGYTGARIENAHVGIRSWHGWVVCTGVQFVNNAVDYLSAKKVLPSQTPTPSGYYGGINRFTNCNFTANDDYKNPSPFTAHVQLVGAVNRSLFNNCKWSTNMVNRPVPAINYGIKAAASYVNVYGINTRFDGLAYGLYTTNNQLPPANQTSYGAGYIDTRVSITDANFDHCAVGIFDRTATGNNYVRNTFKYGRIPAPYLTLLVKNKQNPTQDPNYGAQLGISSETNVFGFTLKDNQFYGQTHPTNASNANPNIRTSVGTNMVQIGTNENIVYRNKFYHLTHANISLGSNANAIGSTGLRYECNDFNDLNVLTLNTRYDVLALDYTYTNPDPTIILPQPIARLKKDQGRPDTINPNIYYPAANCFTDKNNLPQGYESHFWYSNPAKLNYWYDANIPCHKPEENLLNLDEKPLLGASNECNDIIVIGESESNPPQGLTWSPAQTNANRAEYFASMTILENTQGAEVPFYQAKLNDLARFGYLAAIQEEQPFDSLAVWLKRMNTYEAYMHLANEYANRAQYDGALITLQYVQNHFEEANDHDIANLSQIWSVLATPSEQLSAATQALLVEIAEQETLYSSAIARSILTSEGLAHYPPILQLETSVGERSAQLKIEPKAHFLSAIPNPADQQVRIGIEQIDTKVQNCTILISDANGKIVHTQTLAKGQNSLVWHTTHQAAGIYFARLLVDENHRDEIKIVIQR